jgi:hypothetical protein
MFSTKETTETNNVRKCFGQRAEKFGKDRFVNKDIVLVKEHTFTKFSTALEINFISYFPVTIPAKISNAPANILQCTAFQFNYFYSNICPIERMKRNKTKCFHRIHFHSDALSQTASTYRYPTTEKSQHLIPCVLPLVRIRARCLPIIEST